MDIEKEIERLKELNLGAYILIVLLFILFIFVNFQNLENSGLEKGVIAWNQPISDRNLQDEVNKAVEAGMFNVFMNTDLVFENSESKGNLMIQNSETNNAPVFVEIYTKESNEIIYKSYEIPVGYKIEEGRLLKPLEKGVYDCIAYFNVVNEETKVTTSKIGLNVKLTINN